VAFNTTTYTAPTEVAFMKFTRFVLLVSIGMVPAAFGFARPDEPKPDPILVGRPDTQGGGGDAGLGPTFESLAAGISFRPPAGLKQLPRPIGGDDVVQYFDENTKSVFKVSRLVLKTPAPLVSDKDPGGKNITSTNKLARSGMLDLMADQLKMDFGGAEILRQDTIKLVDGDAGIVAARYQIPEGGRLTQRGIIQANDRLYYVLELVTPAPKAGDITQDPQVREAVELFSRVLDSVRLLDQSALEDEKNQRLYRTRAFFTNLTEPRLKAALVPEQWLRIIKDGKDIGYSYVVEEEATDLPHSKLGGKDGAPGPVRADALNGVRVGIRTRTHNTPGERVDAESWFWVSVDRKHELWSNIVYAIGKDAKDKYGEFGSSDQRIRRTVDPNLQPGERLADGRVDEKQPPVREQDIWILNVTPMNVRGNNKAVERQLPPFYLPRAMAQLLPRLVPRWEPKGYVFASYVTDDQKVVLRYVDVESEREVNLGGQAVRAIPVTDRLGYEGSVTTHYISPEGKYLGSVNADTKVTILPSDAATLEKIWKDANLTRPGDVEAPGATTAPSR